MDKSLIMTWLSGLALLLAGCSQDDALQQDGLLLDGKYPLQLTAEVAHPQTRAGGKDTWTGGEEIRVSLEGVFGNKTYVMDASGNASPKDADNTFYWKNTDEARVSAWTLNLEMGETDISDQSGGYAAFDVLYASAMGRYDQAVNLRFIHRMAKIEVILKAGEGITDEELEGATVTIFGDPVTHSTCGLVAPGDQSDGEIKPYYDVVTKKYEALVPPQNMTGKPLVRISIGGNAFTYAPDTEAAGNFWMFGGRRYAYTITVKTNGIDVQTVSSGTWSEGGEENVTSSKTIYYTANEVKAGDYIYEDGTTSDGGLRKRYSDGKPPVIANPKPKPKAGKKVAGVVFWVPKDSDPTGRITPARLSDDKIMTRDFPNCTRGLAVSLPKSRKMDVYQVKEEGIYLNFQDSRFSDLFNDPYRDDYQPIASLTGEKGCINYILGYQNTKVMKAYNKYCKANKKQDNIVWLVDDIEAWTADNPAPKNSTGWFLPSPKELHILCYKDVDNINECRNYSWYYAENYNYIVNPSIAEVDSSRQIETTSYRTSTEDYMNSRYNAYAIHFPEANLEVLSKNQYNRKYLYVCAF